MGRITKGLRKLLGVMDMFIFLTVIMVPLGVCIKMSQIVYFKDVVFFVCELCLNKADENKIKINASLNEF